MLENNIDNPIVIPLWQSFLPIVVLIFLLSASVFLFGDNSSAGANQISLLLACAFAAVIAIINGFSWADIEKGILHGITMSLGAILVLLAVGALIGSWILAGVIPTLIYYGVELIDIEMFYFSCCLVSAIVAITIGSSWTVAGTIGVAFMGIADIMQMDPMLTAGAIISGAYFGDKLSPLSETTNLASAVCKVPLFEHIKSMLITTLPSILLALVMFYFWGLSAHNDADLDTIAHMNTTLRESFYIHPILLLPLVLLMFMAVNRVAAFPSIFISALLGGVFAYIFQFEQAVTLAEGHTYSEQAKAIAGIWISLFDGYQAQTPIENLNVLLSRGGMSSMLVTIWLIFCAMALGGVLEKTGMLKQIVALIIRQVNTAKGLIQTTLLSCFATNVITADQYISIVLPGRMYSGSYDEKNLSHLNLSRALEDAGTLTSVLIPWNTCGAYMAATLGVTTWQYAPYALFNFICPLFAFILASLGLGLIRHR